MKLVFLLSHAKFLITNLSFTKYKKLTLDLIVQPKCEYHELHPLAFGTVFGGLLFKIFFKNISKNYPKFYIIMSSFMLNIS